VNVSKVSDGKVNKNTVDKLTIQNRTYMIGLDVVSCTVVEDFIYITLSLGNHSKTSNPQESYNETTGEYTVGSF